MRYSKIYCLIFLIVLNIYSLTACTSATNQISKDDEILQTKEEGSDENTMNNYQSNTEENILIDIKVGNQIYTAVLYDNPSSKELLKLMPMTVNMNDLNSNEKFYDLKEELPTNTKRIDKINSGDIMLFRSNYLVLFYETFSPSYSYTKIGYIEDESGLKEALGKRDVEITFAIKNKN